MNGNMELMKLNATQARDDGADAAEMVRKVRRAMRGYWAIGIVLGLAAAVAGGIAGFKATKPKYRSEGVVQIKQFRPAVMKGVDDEVPMEVWDAFLESQAALIGSYKLVESALDDPAWGATGLGNSAAVLGGFANNLKVEHRAGKDFLRISFVHPDAKVAGAAVRSIINTYARTYRSEDDRFQQQRIAVLEKQRKELEEKLTGLRERMNGLAEEAGEANIDRMYDVSVAQVATLSRVLTDIRLAMVLASGQPASDGAQTGATTRPVEVAMTPAQVAVVDPTMRGYLAERERLEDALDQFRQRGLGESHGSVVQAKKQLERMDERIAKYAEEYRRVQAMNMAGTATAASIGATGGGGTGIQWLAGQSAAALRNNEAAVAKMLEEAKQEMLGLEVRKIEMTELKAQAKRVEDEAAQINDRISALRVESGLAGRLHIISNGEVPMSPFLDRRLTLAGAGAVAFGCMPLAMLLLLGLAKTKYRYSEEAEADLSRRMPLLGILPTVSEHVENAEEAADAAQCLHQIRVMLQVNANGIPCPCYLVTSAASGEGKTSLVSALALSFAASGSRTLVVDCDLVGQRLTHGFRAEHLSGVFEALSEGSIQPHVSATRHRNLAILPVGQADALDANTLSAASVRRLLEEVKQHFDVVLIDSGPVLGSIEATTVAGQADGVILTISRRQHKPLVERAVRHLDSVGAKLAGMVFNRAKPSDFGSSAQVKSIRSVSSQRAMARVYTAGANADSRMGPLVRSVASLLPNARQEQKTPIS